MQENEGGGTVTLILDLKIEVAHECAFVGEQARRMDDSWRSDAKAATGLGQDAQICSDRTPTLSPSVPLSS